MKKPLLWSIGAFLALTLLVSLLLPSRHRGERAEDVKCRANLRHLWLGMQQYAERNSGTFAPNLAALLVHTDLVPEVFVCQESDDVPSRTRDYDRLREAFAWGGHCSFQYAPPPSKWDEVRSVDVIAFERHPHDGGIAVLFGDGSVERLHGDVVLRLLDQYSQGVRPIRLSPPNQ